MRGASSLRTAELHIEGLSARLGPEAHPAAALQEELELHRHPAIVPAVNLHQLAEHSRPRDQGSHARGAVQPRVEKHDRAP